MAHPEQFPSTLPALVTAIENVLPAVPDAVKAYRELARRFGRAPGLSYAGADVLGPQSWSARSDPPLNPAAGRLVAAFADLVADLPRIAVQLRSLHQETVGPVGTWPLYLVTGAAPSAYLPPGRVDASGDFVTSAGVTVVEVGSDESVPPGPGRIPLQEAGGPYVPWWPWIPAEYAAAGGTVADCPLDALHGVELAGLAATMPLLRGRAAGFDQLAVQLRGGSGPIGNARRIVRSANRRYRAWITRFEPLGDVVAADTAARLNTLSAAVAALVTDSGGDFVMPALTTPAIVRGLSARIRDAITAGHGGRLTVADSEVAFSWAPGQATTLLSYLSTSTVAGRHATVVTARNSATPAGPVIEGGTKPTAVDFVSADVDLVKYAGLAVLTVEASQFVSNIEAAVSSVLVNQIVRAIEKDAAAEMTAAAGEVITGAADITAGVLAAIAAIRENGGNPNVVGLAAADWIELMTQTGNSGYLNFSSAENGPAGTWLGLAPVLIPGQVAGNAIVADGAAVSVLEPAGGPLCVVDPYSKLATNQITIAVEEWATTQVTSPGGVATVAFTVIP